jgi:predicted Zn-dependent protease
MPRFCLILLLLAAVPALPLASQSKAPARTLKAAKTLLEKGNFQEAIALLTELQQASPSSTEIQMDLGTAYASTGNLAAAAKEFEAIRQRDPNFVPATLSLAGVLMQLGRPPEAIALLTDQVARTPRSGDARNMLASLYRATGDLTRANEQIRELVALAPKNPRTLHLLYLSYQEIARQSFALVEQGAPESAYMVAMAGLERLAKEEYSSAFYLLQEALRRDPKLLGVHSALATVYAKTAHADWAATAEAREKQMAPPDCGLVPGACAYRKGDLEAVLQETRFARLPEDLYWRYRAVSDLASRTYAALQALPPSVQSQAAKAERSRDFGLHKDAVEAWKKAIALAPENAGLQKELVVSLYQARDYPACAAAADKLLKSNPDDPELQLLRGDAALSQQDAKTALPHLEKAVALNPEMLPARASLGRALLQLGNAALAVPQLERALPFDRDGAILYLLAQAYQQSGQEERGKQALARYQEFSRRDRAEKTAMEEKFQITPP